MGKVLQVRISVAAVRESEHLRAVSPVQVPQQEEPAAVSAEIRRDLLRRTTETRADSPHKKEIPMTPVSHGKPCAGNPHARFDEGASASEEPRRNALLHNGASMTLRPASGGLKETAFNLGNAGGIADWCGQRDDVSCRWSKCPVGMLAAGFALSPVIAEDAA